MNALIKGDQAGAAVISLSIDGMTCASCVGRVERALKGVAGVSEAVVNLATERATIRGLASADTLIAAVKHAGYEAQARDAIASSDGDEAIEKKEVERTALKRNLLLSAVLATIPGVLAYRKALADGLTIRL